MNEARDMDLQQGKLHSPAKNPTHCFSDSFGKQMKILKKSCPYHKRHHGDS